MIIINTKLNFSFLFLKVYDFFVNWSFMVHTIFQVATFIHKIISDFVASLIDKPRLNKVWIKMSHFTLADRPGSVNDFFQAMNKQILKAVFLPIKHKREKLNSRHNSYQTLITTSGACFILCIAWSIEEDFWRKQRPRENEAKEERKQENILENLFWGLFCGISAGKAEIGAEKVAKSWKDFYSYDRCKIGECKRSQLIFTLREILV